MSNIYIQEPPTSGKVLLKTTVGDIDIELWSREAPKACKNFVQLSLENYYDDTCFHRVVKGFIAQGGDPNGDGTGGESTYGAPFKDEFHSRLRFVRRGLVAMANAGKDDNGSQFFFTLAPCPELQNKHTIFGKVAGDTLYNMLKLEDCSVDHDDRPEYPHKILTSQVLLNPFPDIIPRSNEKVKVSEFRHKPKEKVQKNFKLLSFGEEAEEEEVEDNSIAQKFRGKSKSSHDLTKDPKLSTVSVLSLYENSSENEGKVLESVRKKLKKDSAKELENKETADIIATGTNREEIEDLKRKEIQQSIKELTSYLRKDRCQTNINKDPVPDEESTTDIDALPSNPLLREFREGSMLHKKKSDPVLDRQQLTAKYLTSFKQIMTDVQKSSDEPDSVEPDSVDDSEASEEFHADDKTSWIAHTLHCNEGIRDAKDVNIHSEDRYDITDPRNPITQRRRHGQAKKSKL